MTSQVGPEDLTPSSEEPLLHQTQIAGTTDDSSIQDADESIVLEPSPGIADTEVDQTEEGISKEAVAEYGSFEVHRRQEDHEILVQKLNDQLNGLERLPQASLSEKLEDQSDQNQCQRPRRNRQIQNPVPSLPLSRNYRTTLMVEEYLSRCLRTELIAWRGEGQLMDRLALEKPRLPSPQFDKDAWLSAGYDLEGEESNYRTIPQLHYVQWSDFKNKLLKAEKTYAVEVLIGGAKYYYQQDEEERKGKQLLEDHSNDRNKPTSEKTIKLTQLPERIRINSKSVIMIMNDFDPVYNTDEPLVILRPFKHLVYYEDRIRERYEMLKSKWRNAGTKASTSQALGAPVTTDGVDSTTTAIMAQTIQQLSEAAAEKDLENAGSEKAQDLTHSIEALKDLRCLIEFMDLELRPVLDSYRGSTRQKVCFSELWHLFKPGEFVHCPLDHRQNPVFVYRGGKFQPQNPKDRIQEVMRIVCTAGGRPHLEEGHAAAGPESTLNKGTVNSFIILAYSVDFNGTHFVPTSFIFYLVPFSGEQDITSLQCHPLRYSPKADELKSKWKSRGEAFCEYTTFKYKYYTGKTLTDEQGSFSRPGEEFPRYAEHIESQVVIDFSEAFAVYPMWRPDRGNLTLDAEIAPGELVENYPTSYWSDEAWKIFSRDSGDEIYNGLHIDTKLMEEYKENDPLLRGHSQVSNAVSCGLGEDHLVLLPNRVFAFVMKSRRWAMLSVDGLRPIKRHVEGFDSLQLPIGHKNTIRSLVDTQIISRNRELDDLEASYDTDLVRGKGKGLIILLHGAPGVGKTSTAETVAESFGKLLLPITCGDLGLTADRVELELLEKFHLAELWDCVLLLDEADVLLARRTNTDIKRNSLVSVFLRVLEHFTGVLFLTTNRVGAFDEAFKSRIHISLYYPPLDAEKTLDIWKMNLERLSRKENRRNEPMEFNEKEILEYARSHYIQTSPRKANWNGRQIRNAFQTASALAKFEALEQNRQAKADSENTGKDFKPSNPQLRVRHFKEIALASYEFDKYISETRGGTDTEIAFRESQRMDEYQPSRRYHRDREQQPKQMMDIPAFKTVPNHALGPSAQSRAPLARQTSTGGIRPVYAGSTTEHIFDQDSPYYRQSARRRTQPVNTYGAPTSATNPTIERPSAVRSRSKATQQPGFFIAHNRKEERQEALYEDEFEEEPLYQESREEYTYEPTGNYEDTNQRGEFSRRRQGGNFHGANQSTTLLGYDETLEDEEDTFSN